MRKSFGVLCLMVLAAPWVWTGCGRVSGEPGMETVVVRRPIGGKTTFLTTLRNVESTGLFKFWAMYEPAGWVDPKPQTYREEFSVTLADDENIQFNAYLIMAVKPGQAKMIRDQYGDDWYESAVQRPFTEKVRASTTSYRVFQVKDNRLKISEQVKGFMKNKFKDSPFVMLDVMIGTITFRNENVAMAAVLADVAKERSVQADILRKIQAADNSIAELEANGQAEVRDILQGTLTDQYNVYEGLLTLRELAEAPNTEFYFIPFGGNEISLILGDDDVEG